MRFLLCIGLLLFFLPLQAQRHVVSDVAQLKRALTACKPGDTIIVKAGVYKTGNLRILTPLVLLGENHPVLDGENKYEILTVEAERVTINGFALRNTGISSVQDYGAVKANAAHYLRVTNNTLENTFFGIHLSNTDHAVITGNTIRHRPETEESRVGNAIHLWKCSDARIQNNDISGHRDGIYFEFVTGSTIEKNVSHHNIRYGLHFMFSHQDHYFSNRFTENGAGVAVMYTHSVTMKDNTFSRSWGPSAYGLLLKEIRDSEVTQNHFDHNTMAIYMEGSSRISFLRNDFYQNGYAVRMQASCDGNHFSWNNFRGNTFDMATNGSLVLNTLDHNYWDRYDGYDLNRDGVGDVAYHPANLFTLVVERIPAAMILYRSFMVFLLDRAERTLPAVLPENLKDTSPLMKYHDHAAPSL